MSEEGRRRYEVGVEGDRFNLPRESPACAETGCVPAPLAEGSDARDAQRYRFLRDHARPADPHMDGSFNWYVPGLTLPRRTRTFDQAVDAAMGRERGVPATPCDEEEPCDV